MSGDGHHHDRDDRAGVQLRQGLLIEAGAGPRAGPAAVYRLRPSVELFPASDGRLYFIRPGPGPDLAVPRPEPADRALLERLAAGAATADELCAAADVTPGELARKLESLAAADLLLVLRAPQPPLEAGDAERFARQLPYFAERGDPAAAQRALLDARVVILGCGGLGTWALGALATAGVRRFVLVDDDTIELSNLNRQILYDAGDVGAPKVERAAAWVERFEPRSDVTRVARRIRSAEDLRDVVAGADALVHAADWPPYDIVRWADEACREAGVPYITAGQAPPVLKIGPTYVPGRSACFACHEAALHAQAPLFAELAAQRRAQPAPATTLGPASGVIGALLAMEVMHLLVGAVTPATEGRALLLDMETLETRWEAIDRRADCPACNHLVWHGSTRAGSAADSARQGVVAPAASAPVDGVQRSRHQPG